MDVGINPNPNPPSTPNKVLRDAPLPRLPKVVACRPWFNRRNDHNPLIKHNKPDPNRLTGRSVIIWASTEYLIERLNITEYNIREFNYGDRRIVNFMSSTFCPNCTANCLSSDKRCPDECITRWQA